MRQIRQIIGTDKDNYNYIYAKEKKPIMNLKLNDEDRDVVLMSLYHYQLLCMKDKKMKDVLKRVNKLICEISTW